MQTFQRFQPTAKLPTIRLRENTKLIPTWICMAHPRRVAKVTSQINREISQMFVLDPVVSAAICPEHKTGGDSSVLSAVASVTDVYVSNDLQVVKVYVSIFSDPKGRNRAMQNLEKLAPYVRHQIGQSVRLRLTPEIRFEYDDTLEELDKVEKVLGDEELNRIRLELDGPDEKSEKDESGFFDLSAEDDENVIIDDSDYPDVAFPRGPMKGPFDDLFTGSPSGGIVQEKRRGKRKPAGAKR